MKWQPAKPRTRIKVIECGAGHWDEQDHGLDIPRGIHTTDFKLTGAGHERIERIERIFDQACRDCGIVAGLNEKQPEHRIAAWLFEHACSYCSAGRLVRL